MTESYISKTSGLNNKDYLAYAFGDVACCLVFGIVTNLLQRFYTDVLLLGPLFIMFMMFFARIWDAINDPMMGRIADTIKPSKWGRYRPWFLYAAIPLTVFTILMMLDVKSFGFSSLGVAIWATVTYVGFGMSYTMLQIPYGSLASVVTTDEKERTKLSTWRSAGATIGSMPVMIIGFICYTDTGRRVGDFKVTTMNGTIVLIGTIVLALASCAMLIVAFKNNKERVIAQPKVNEKGATLKAIKRLFKSKSFIMVSLASMLLLGGQMFTGSFNQYLFDVYFKAPSLGMLPTIFSYLPMAVLMFFTPKLVRKYGKKELCAFGAFLAAGGNVLAFFIRYINLPTAILMWVFLACCLIQGIGLVFMTLQVWAMATDSIDDIEIKTGERDDGSAYSVFMFFRKVGQALSAVVVNVALISFGYGNFSGQEGMIEWKIGLTNETLVSIYNLSTIIPAVIFALMGLFLVFNPLNKKNVALLQIEKEKKLEEDFKANKINIQ